MPLWMGVTLQATAGFQDADIFQRAKKKNVEMHSECDFFTFQDSNFNPIPPMPLSLADFCHPQDSTVYCDL